MAKRTSSTAASVTIPSRASSRKRAKVDYKEKGEGDLSADEKDEDVAKRHIPMHQAESMHVRHPLQIYATQRGINLISKQSAIK